MIARPSPFLLEAVAAGSGPAVSYLVFGSTAPAPTPVPEPASLLLFGVGLAGLGVSAWRRRRVGIGRKAMG